jgi:6-pyruvoyltetrahydropterin/6-carboxytetrahydropterin synthase
MPDTVPRNVAEARYAIIRRLNPFDMGHRVPGHAGKCANYHGHTWTAELCVSAPALDSVGVVTDFAVLKERVGGWIDTHLDHGMCLHYEDPMAEWLTLQAMLLANKAGGTPTAQEVMVRVQRDQFLDTPHKLYLMDDAPTSENLARLLYEKAQELLADIPHLHVEWVRLWETTNCLAQFPFVKPVWPL